jgi:hypothetical protein
VVDENVIVFSNRYQDERCLVIYHNCFGYADGSIKMSVAFSKENESGGSRSLVQKTIAQGLDLSAGQSCFVVFRDLVTQLKYIRNCRQLHEQGLYIKLDAYQTHVFLDFREIEDDERANNARLNTYLNGRGVPSLDEAMREMSLQPLHQAFQELCRPELIESLQKLFHGPIASHEDILFWKEMNTKIHQLTAKSGELGQNATASVKNAEAMINELIDFQHLLSSEKPRTQDNIASIATKYLLQYFLANPELELIFVFWLMVRNLSEKKDVEFSTVYCQSHFEAWQLDVALNKTLLGLGWSKERSETALSLIKIAVALEKDFSWFASIALTAGTSSITGPAVNFLKTSFAAAPLCDFLQVHSFQESLFFNQEAFEKFNDWAIVLILWELNWKGENQNKECSSEEILNLMKFLPVIAAKAGYKLEVFLEKLDRLAAM